MGGGAATFELPLELLSARTREAREATSCLSTLGCSTQPPPPQPPPQLPADVQEMTQGGRGRASHLHDSTGQQKTARGEGKLVPASGPPLIPPAREQNGMRLPCGTPAARDSGKGTRLSPSPTATQPGRGVAWTLPHHSRTRSLSYARRPHRSLRRCLASTGHCLVLPAPRVRAVPRL